MTVVDWRTPLEQWAGPSCPVQVIGDEGVRRVDRVLAADVLVRCLENEGVRYVFGIPGEETLELTDALRDSSIRFITVRHEQGAAFMADVHGRLSRRAGVCLSTLGPGATNLLTGVVDAYLDRAPLVAITGQASTTRRHKESHQYIDVPSLFKPVCKWNASLIRPSIIPEAVRKAFKVAQTEKPGATHLELPEDVAGESVGSEGDVDVLQVQSPVASEPVAGQIARAVDVIGRAKRPMILAGNGVVRGGAHAMVRALARELNIPVIHTFMAKGVLPDNDPLSLYTIGLQMRDYAGALMEEADVIVAVGYDFVEYAPCHWNPRREKRIVHVDVSPAEVDEHYVVEVGVLGGIGLSLDLMRRKLAPFDGTWAAHCRTAVRSGFEAELDLPAGWPLRPQHVLRDLRALLSSDDLVICDVGAHKLWVARMFECWEPNTCVISNGFAAMGIALPGAVAAKLLFPERQVVAVTGDGGFLMNAQELETAVRLGLAIVIVVWRDDGYGVIRWKQTTRFGRTNSVDFGNPDIVSFAQSFGAAGYRVTHASEFSSVMAEALRAGKPSVIDCPIDYGENLRLTDRLSRLS